MKPCPEPMELATVADLPEAHPLRQHMRDCPRCRATVRSMEAFERSSADQDVPEADVADANRRLQRFIDSELVEDEPVPPRVRPHARTLPLRPATWIAAAAVLLIVVGIWQIGSVLQHTGHDVGTQMRGEATPETFVPAVSTGTAGTMTASWDPVEGADDYVVILWDETLEPVARLEPSAETTRSLESHGAWLSVVARQDGREIARSELVRIP